MVKAVSGKGKSMCKGKEGRQNLAWLKNCKHLIKLEHGGGSKRQDNAVGRARYCCLHHPGGKSETDFTLQQSDSQDFLLFTEKSRKASR